MKPTQAHFNKTQIVSCIRDRFVIIPKGFLGALQCLLEQLPRALVLTHALVQQTQVIDRSQR